ncbi:two-component sensor histidine kinase [Arthrobacter sp. MYb227]|uniref:sensor histidine kinase n=1 Tax=Arthrobacter sp. MYb227 TaxID=1848601 RepID=UPI000CFD1119|nr:HAMP domain-containing sensor histidine kinase [Arthrobacter sp. MYb227]PQZ94936.1 two-component sensor histidine kinase [Arthrobacter sp. MYb227]
MKARVLGVLSVLVILLVLIISNVILTSSSRELTQEIQINRVASLNRIALLAYDATVETDTSGLQLEMDTYSALYDEGILVRLQGKILESGALDARRADVIEALGRASLNLSDTTLPVITPLGSGTEVISRSVGSANQVLGEVVLEVRLDAARQKLLLRWLLVGLAAAGLSILLLFAAWRVTGWVLRPVHRLNEAVTQLRETGRSDSLPEDGPPELRELNRSFTAMAEAVSESLESQRQLIADTSHELRNPIGALRLRVDLLLLQLSNATEREAGAGVLKELERVEELLDSVLRLAVAEHRAFEGSAREALNSPNATMAATTNPFLVVEEEIDRAQPAALRAGTSISFDTVEDPQVVIACNPVELAQMIGELLTNALKYAEGSKISAALHVGLGRVVIAITDSGPGLTGQQLAQATTRFWRGTGHEGIRGTGMGMTIVQKLAEANGGHLVLGPNDTQGLSARLEFGVKDSHPTIGTP